jgi:hypothetical protein
MRPSKARINANRKWDGRHIRTVSCRMRTEDAAAFARICKREGTTMHAVLLQYVARCVTAGEIVNPQPTPTPKRARVKEPAWF